MKISKPGKLHESGIGKWFSETSTRVERWWMPETLF